MPRTGLALLPILVVGALCGCSVPTNHELKIGKANAVATIDRPLALDIENVRGSVEVEVMPGLTKPVLQAWVLDQSDQFMRLTDDALVKSWYAAEIVSVQGTPTLRILTTRGKETKPSFVKLVVHTPTCEGIRVRNSGGMVYLRGVGGEITIENGYKGGEGGDVKVATERRLSGPVNVRTTHGDITVVIPTTCTGKLELNTPKGAAQLNVRSDGLEGVKKTLTSYTATLNGGTKPWQFLSAEGNVRVEVGHWEPTGLPE